MSEEKQSIAPGTKTREGVVLKAKMQKTVIVEVARQSRHAKYGKFMKGRVRYPAHDELSCKVGDLVVIEETRPMSKTKRWKVREVLKRATE